MNIPDYEFNLVIYVIYDTVLIMNTCWILALSLLFGLHPKTSVHSHIEDHVLIYYYLVSQGYNAFKICCIELLTLNDS